MSAHIHSVTDTVVGHTYTIEFYTSNDSGATLVPYDRINAPFQSEYRQENRGGNTHHVHQHYIVARKNSANYIRFTRNGHFNSGISNRHGNDCPSTYGSISFYEDSLSSGHSIQEVIDPWSLSGSTSNSFLK